VPVVNSSVSPGLSPGTIAGLFGIGITAVLSRWPHSTRQSITYDAPVDLRTCGGRRVGEQIVAERFAGQALLERGLQHSVS
jgi:hypothetical protein